MRSTRFAEVAMGGVVQSVEYVFPERDHFGHLQLIIRIKSKQISFLQHQHANHKYRSHTRRFNHCSYELLLHCCVALRFLFFWLMLSRQPKSSIYTLNNFILFPVLLLYLTQFQ